MIDISKKFEDSIDEFVISTNNLLHFIKSNNLPLQEIALHSGLSKTTMYDKMKNYTLTPYQWRNILKSVEFLMSEKQAAA